MHGAQVGRALFNRQHICQRNNENRASAGIYHDRWSWFQPTFEKGFLEQWDNLQILKQLKAPFDTVEKKTENPANLCRACLNEQALKKVRSLAELRSVVQVATSLAVLLQTKVFFLTLKFN